MIFVFYSPNLLLTIFNHSQWDVVVELVVPVAEHQVVVKAMVVAPAEVAIE